MPDTAGSAAVADHHPGRWRTLLETARSTRDRPPASSVPSGVRGAASRRPPADLTRLGQCLRGVAVVLVLATCVLAPAAAGPGREAAVLVSLGYGACVVLGHPVLLSRRVRSAAAVSTTLLLADGIWLAAATCLTGGLESLLVPVVLLHVAVITLAAGRRAGLVLALWHSLVLAVHAVDRSGLRLTEGGPAGPGPEHLVVSTVALLLAALSTAAVSAVTTRELRRQHRELELLARLAVDLEGAHDAEQVGRILLDTLAESCDFSRGVVLAGPDGSLPLLASAGLAPATVDRPGRPGRSAAVDQAYRTGEPLLLTCADAEADAWLDHLLPGATDLVVLPLLAASRPVGAVVLEGAGRPDECRTVLERAASHAALALRNAWRLEQVQRLAATDGLTKIANRRTFETTLEREVSRAVRAGQTVSLVMVDIDHFKLLNDTYGHQAGDEVLRNVAAALSCECRDFDTAARYGGEEFAVVLPDCGPEEAAVIGERLRRAVSAAPSVVQVTASAGVATFPVHARDPETLVRAADQALYRSKHDGRDRMTVSAGMPLEAHTEALLRRAVTQRLGRAPERAAGALQD